MSCKLLIFDENCKKEEETNGIIKNQKLKKNDNTVGKYIKSIRNNSQPNFTKKTEERSSTCINIQINQILMKFIDKRKANIQQRHLKSKKKNDNAIAIYVIS